MIPLEVFLAILDEKRAEVIAGLESPSNPSEFGFGTLHGMLAAIESIRTKIDELVEQHNTQENDR